MGFPPERDARLAAASSRSPAARRMASKVTMAPGSGFEETGTELMTGRRILSG